jgi:hypothetical protein
MAQGDQIYVYRELLNLQGFYEHHGIDCGDGSVIHYRKPSEIIERTSLEVFTKGNRFYVKNYTNGFYFIPEIVVQRAESRLGENKYNLVFNNCEHFATWCKTGMSLSQQVKEFVPIITHLNINNLYDPLKQAFASSDPKNAGQLLNEALSDIRLIWNDIQPKYKEAIQERDTWQKVAIQAVKQNREDLARAALSRKVIYQKKIDNLQDKLQHLAEMTETLIRNSRHLT